MTILVEAKNVSGALGFRSVFKMRDIFVHDGRKLRRVSVPARLQVAGLVALLALVAWSGFATVQFLTVASSGAEIARNAELERMEQQVEAMRADVHAIKVAADKRLELTETEVRKLGLDPARFTGTGGPFEAVEPLKAGDSKFKQLFTSWKKLDQVEQGTIAIPSTQPVKGSNFTSGYGVRSDPFRGRAAMHAGIDLAGPLGTPIYATADAIVGRSEWANGYGNLIELNHGRGIQTRYGHRSKSRVKAGQRVKRGDMIALMGSTGRSTGSHLHYEVRVDGKAVNPIPYMQGSDILLAAQRRAATAMGGPVGGSK